MHLLALLQLGRHAGNGTENVVVHAAEVKQAELHGMHGLGDGSQRCGYLSRILAPQCLTEAVSQLLGRGRVHAGLCSGFKHDDVRVAANKAHLKGTVCLQIGAWAFAVVRVGL